MKHSLILIITAVFGLAQFAHAENPNDKNKNKKPAHPPVAAVHAGKPQGMPAQHAMKAQGMPAASAYQHHANVNAAKIHNAGIEKAQLNHQNNVATKIQKQKVQQQNAIVSQQHIQQLNNQKIAGQNAKLTVQQVKLRNLQNQQIKWRNRPWSGTNFADARSHWIHEHHDHGWWRSHYRNIVLFGGGYYYWDGGYWYPAYGYDSGYSNYAYEGPIYGYADIPPGDLITQLQVALRDQGYYEGPVDGDIGPVTREAIARFQSDNGLEVTSAVDRPTLESLGLV